jgi:DNA-binding response OmpR family regulator
LSGQDGRVICKKLKKFPTTKNIPVIMMSAHPSAEKSAREACADEFIAKPFDIDDLSNARTATYPAVMRT